MNKDMQLFYRLMLNSINRLEAKSENYIDTQGTLIKVKATNKHGKDHYYFWQAMPDGFKRVVLYNGKELWN